MSDFSTEGPRSVRLVFPSEELDLRQLQIVLSGLDRIYSFAALTVMISAREPTEPGRDDAEDFHATHTLFTLADALSDDFPRPPVLRIQRQSPLWIELAEPVVGAASTAALSVMFYRLVKGGFRNIESIVNLPHRTRATWFEWQVRAERAKRDWEAIKGAAGEPAVSQAVSGGTDAKTMRDSQGDLAAYKSALQEAGYAPATIRSYVDRAAAYERWRGTGKVGS